MPDVMGDMFHKWEHARATHQEKKQEQKFSTLIKSSFMKGFYTSFLNVSRNTRCLELSLVRLMVLTANSLSNSASFILNFVKI